jgi:hypothetical protein
MNKKQKQIQIQLKKRSRRILLIAAAFVFLLLATTTYFIVTKGFDYVKDIIGHPTKELLEGEWIKYLRKSWVAIETPKVLKRIDLTKSLPKNGLQLVKEMQSFAYGSFVDNFI